MYTTISSLLNLWWHFIQYWHALFYTVIPTAVVSFLNSASSIFLILNGVWLDTCIFRVSDLNSFHNKLCIDILFYPWNDIKKRHLNHYDKLRKLKEIPERFSTVKVFWSVPVFVPLFYWWIVRSYFSLYQACAFLHTANISSVGRGGKYIFS